MKEGEAAAKAISGIIRQAGYRSAIRHLVDRGLTLQEIKENLSWPASDELILGEIREYEEEKKRIAEGGEVYDYEPQMDSFGRVSLKYPCGFYIMI